MKNICLLALAFLSISNVSHGMIIYGDDNRVEPFESSEMQQQLTLSTAGMLDNIKIVSAGENAVIPPKTIVNDMGLCRDEKFADQPSAVYCSGFLVAPDLLVTAGHCIPNQAKCDTVSWIFDYKVNERSGRADVMIPKTNIFKCKKVIETKLLNLEGDIKDYALIKLDRPVFGRTPIKVRTSGKIMDNSEIFVIGHPSGLPSKVAGDASVTDNKYESYFKTNLDTFGGNSGSAVFNAESGTVEGVLVRGAKDYYGDKGCVRVFIAPQEIKDYPRLGESVSRITDLKSLKALNSFLVDVVAGDVVKVNETIEKLGTTLVVDESFNTAVHLAVDAGQNKVLDLLIAAGANLDLQNNLGETALHRAALHNNSHAIKSLIDAGAEVLVKDKDGKLASARAQYFSFGEIKLMKEAEKQALGK